MTNQATESLATHQPHLIGFDDLFTGMQFISTGRTITEADIANFAGVSGDFNPLHTDAEWVRAHTEFEGPIAHGLLVHAVSSGIRTPGYDDLLIQAFLSTHREMTHPTYPGDTVKVINTVRTLKPSRSRPGSGVVTVDVDVRNQHNVTVQKGTDTFLVGKAEDTTGRQS